jgi:molybdate transport system ATP-binding protein
MLEIDVRKRLGRFVLEMRFRAPARGITALFGRSGSGKTSVLAAIAGLARPDAGRIAVGDTVLFDSERGVDVRPELRRVGYVFQDARLFPHLTVRDNLRYGWKRAPQAERRIGFDEVVALLGIGHLLDRRPGRLSGGEKQRVAVGRALLVQPRILLMDEPLASLDAARKREILHYIERLRDETHIPIVYVSHEIEEVVRLADTMVLVSEGRAAACDTVPAIMNRLDLKPMTGRFEGGAVLDGVVAFQDLDYGLSRIVFPGGELQATGVDALPGERVRVRIRSRDVSIALTVPERISIRNVLAGRVVEVGPLDGAEVDLRIAVGASTLLARLTRRSFEELGLGAGSDVFAMVKSVAIDRRSAGYA